MSYTPTKGSARPVTPGANPMEVVLTAAENLESKIPNLPELSVVAGDIAVIVAAAQAAYSAIDPNGLKGSQRNALIKDAYTRAKSTDPTLHQSGLDDLATFARDIPAHPTPWVRDARWCSVDAGGGDPLPNGP